MALPKEIQDIVNKCEEAGYENTVIALFDEDYGLEGSDWKSAKEFFTELKKEVDYQFMEGKGGYEGSGEHCSSVIRLGDKFFTAEWSYYSYHGCDYDYIEETIKEVKPVTKTITVYE